jgi:hypothetical protein
MSDSNLDCLRCHATMEQGFVVDRGHGNSPADVATWVSGAPEKSWTGSIKTKGHELRRLTTFLCQKCGYVEFRALASE